MSCQVQYSRECLLLPDGGTVGLDTVQAVGSGAAAVSAPGKGTMVLLVPGLGGSSEDSYVQSMAAAVVKVISPCATRSSGHVQEAPLCPFICLAFLAVEPCMHVFAFEFLTVHLSPCLPSCLFACLSVSLPSLRSGCINTGSYLPGCRSRHSSVFLCQVQLLTP